MKLSCTWMSLDEIITWKCMEIEKTKSVGREEGEEAHEQGRKIGGKWCWSEAYIVKRLVWLLWKLTWFG